MVRRGLLGRPLAHASRAARISFDPSKRKKENPSWSSMDAYDTRISSNHSGGNKVDINSREADESAR